MFYMRFTFVPLIKLYKLVNGTNKSTVKIFLPLNINIRDPLAFFFSYSDTLEKARLTCS